MVNFTEILLCSLLLWTVTQADVSNSPTLTYTCESQGVASIQTASISKVHVLVDESNNVYCIPKDTSLTNCYDVVSPKITKLPQPLRVLYEEEKNPKIIGGQVVFFYQLICNDTTQTLKAKASFKTNQTEGYNSRYETTDLKDALHLQISTSNISIVDPTEVQIGGELFLFMTGPDNYILNPGTCTAYPKDPTIIATMWNNTGNNACNSYDKALIEQKWTGNNTHLYIKVYGFRFVGSDEVTINCSAQVCPHLSKCNQFCVTNTTTATNRRRRNAIIDKDNEEKSAFVTFRVTAHQGSNAAAGITSRSGFCMVLVLVAVGWTQRMLPI